jgi:hypothetical protein
LAGAVCVLLLSGCAESVTPAPNPTHDLDPTVSLPTLTIGEDDPYALDLRDKIASPLYPATALRISATSSDLSIALNGLGAVVTNKTKDWNGPATIVWTVDDPENRRTVQQTAVSVAPRTDVKGYLEDVLTGVRLPGIPIAYLGTNVVSDANGQFVFQAPVSFDNLSVNSTQYYNVAFPIGRYGQDVDLGNLQMIARYTDPITGEDLLSFMKNYMLNDRWDDADLPVRVFIDNNPPSADYREAVRQGLMSWDPVVNQWIPEGRKLTLAQIVSSDPTRGVRVDYSVTGPSFTPVEGEFLKGRIDANPTQLISCVARAMGHEMGHALGWLHTPYAIQIMGTSLCSLSLPSPFEGLVVATKYKLKKGVVGFYSK